MTLLNFRARRPGHLFLFLGTLMLILLFGPNVLQAQAVFTEADANLPKTATGAAAELIAKIDQQRAIGAITQVRYATMVTQPADLETITLNLFPDLTLVAAKGWEEVHSNGQRSWVGKVAGDPMSFVSLVYRDGQMVGDIRTDGALYLIRHLANGVHAIQDLDQSFFRTVCNVDASHVVQPSSETEFVLPEPLQKTTTQEWQIDLMVLYTAAARNDAGGENNMQMTVTNTINWANQAFINSRVNMRFRVVLAQLTNYVETRNDGTDLDRLTNTNDGFLDEVHGMRDQVGADLVALYTGNGDPSGASGIAWVPNQPVATGIQNAAANAFSVTQGIAFPSVFTHELAHNLGGYHDRYVENGGDAQLSNYGRVNLEERWLTIMSYPNQCRDNNRNCQEIQYYSNPNVGHPTTNTPLGIPDGQANAADNARALNSTAQAAAGYRGQAVGTPPTLSLSQAALNATVVQGAVSNQTIAIRNTAAAGAGALVWQVAKAPPPNEPPCNWLTLTPPTNGSEPAGTTHNLQVQLSAANLQPGTYRCNIVVTSNDPNAQTTTIPVTFNVGGLPQPRIAVNPNNHNYGNINVQATGNRVFQVSNTGAAPLVVTATSLTGANNGEFNIANGGGAFTLAPAATRDISVDFRPATGGLKNANLTIASNDPNAGLTLVALNGTGVVVAAANPDIAVNPGAINVTVNQGQNANRNLTISNTAAGGADALNWQIATQAGASTQALVAEMPVPTDGVGANNDRSVMDNIVLTKGGADTRQGATSTARGGPDAFGYTWVDSQEGDGPNFNWIEISNLGTELNFTQNSGLPPRDEGFATVAIPFAFPFYGTNQTTVRVGANGFLTFDNVPNETWQNRTLPSGNAPNGLIAVFWDDLDGSNGGRAFRYFDQANNRLIIQWEAFRRFQDAATTLRFQAILEPSGAITLQYRSMNGTTNSASVGIENPAGSVGLQVAFNNNYVQNNRAVRFQPPQAAQNCDWLAANPGNGTTNAGGNSNINVVLNAANLGPGNYTCRLVITSNDPDENPVTVPVNLTVQAVAAVPDIAVNQTTFNVTVNQGQNTNRNLTISNTAGAGANALTWNITTQPVTTALALFAEAGGAVLPYSGETAHRADLHENVVLTKTGQDTRQGAASSARGGPDAFGYTWVDSDEGDGPNFNWQEISNTGTELNFNHTGGLPPRDEGFATVTIPFAFPFYGTNRTTMRVGANGFLTFDNVPNETWQNRTMPSGNAPNSMIAAFWDDLDGTNGGRAYRFHDQANNRFIIQWQNFQRFQDGGTSLTFQAILQPDGTIILQYRSMNGTTNSASVGIENPAGSVGLGVAFNNNYVQNNRAVRFQPPGGPPPVANCDWLAPNPTNGTTNAGANSNINVAINAAALGVGNYSCQMVIATNDPDENPVNVTVNLTVQAVVAAPPDIAISTAAFNVTLNPGQADNRNLTISNTAPGGGNALTWNITTAPVTTSLALVSDQHEVPFMTNGGTNGERAGPREVAVLTKGGLDPRRGSAPLSARGGPDAFGYTWVDSDENDGPNYNWVDADNDGTELNFGHNGGLPPRDEGFVTVNLPFAFPFYGVNQNTVQVAANGFLSFGAVPDETWQNQGIPNGAAPNGLIAPFWDDLDGTNGGRGYQFYDQANNRFVIQWHRFERFQDNNTNLRFQVILQPDGTIIFQYRDINGTSNSATIGIENPAGTVGLQVAFNNGYARDDLAVRFQPPQVQPPPANCDWLTVTPNNGTTNAGGNSNVTVGLNAANLAVGNYSCRMTIATNDPDENPVTVDVNLMVQTASPPSTTTDVERTGNLPEDFELGQNYPNPFNPDTEIRFAIPEPGFVRLVIHNMLGQKIRVLVSEMREPGHYAINWDGTNDLGQPVGNGVYLYRISAAGFSQVKKMIMMK